MQMIYKRDKLAMQTFKVNKKTKITKNKCSLAKTETGMTRMSLKMP